MPLLEIKNLTVSFDTSVGLFKAVVGVILIFGANWVARRFNQTGIF